jgi:hypothetical protein
LLESLPEKVKTALNAQDSRLKTWLTKARIHFGDDDPCTQSLKQFSDDLLYLNQRDKINPEMRDEFLIKAKEVLEDGELDSTFLSAKKSLEYEGMEKLACIGRIKFGRMDDSLAFLDEVKNLVDYGVRMLEEGNDVDDAEKEVKGKIESCRQKLQAIEEGVVKLKKEQ